MNTLIVKTIERMSLKNICIMLNLEYEQAKSLKKKDIVYMINNCLSVVQMIALKQQQIQEQLQQLKESKPKKVVLSEDELTELKQKRKEKAELYFQTDRGKLALQKAQKKYHEKKRQKILSKVSL